MKGYRRLDPVRAHTPPTKACKHIMRPNTPEDHIRDARTTPRTRANTCVPRHPPPRWTPAHPRNLYPKALSQPQTNGSGHTAITGNGCPETVKICSPPARRHQSQMACKHSRKGNGGKKGILRARPPPLWSGLYNPWAPSLLGWAYSFARVLIQPRHPPWSPPGPRTHLTDLKSEGLTFRSLAQTYYQPAQTYKQHVPLIPAAYCQQALQVKETSATCYQPSWAMDRDKPRSRYVTCLIKQQGA